MLVVCLFVCLVGWLVVCLFVCLFACLFVCLFVCFFLVGFKHQIHNLFVATHRREEIFASLASNRAVPDLVGIGG